MSTGFWICVIAAIIEFILTIISIVKGGVIWLFSLLGCIILLCAAIIYSNNKDCFNEPVSVESIKTLQVDTTYIVNKDKVDTVYKVNYLKYGNNRKVFPNNRVYRQ